MWPALFLNRIFKVSSMSISRWKGRKGIIFLLIWRAFNISFRLITVRMYVSRAVFLILMVHHFLRTKCPFLKGRQHAVFFKNHTHILTRTQGKKFEHMFLVNIASKGTSLRFVILNFTLIANF